MAAATYKVTVYDHRFVTIVQVGDGDRWIHDTAKKIEGTARVIAPRRTGRLASSHVTLPTRGSNQFQKRYRVSALAPYSLYVHEGTGIYGPRRVRIQYASPVGPIAQRRPGQPRFIRSQRGQRPQPWLTRAADMVIASV
jgi:hypothetical protein